ncbi:hypothetical protein [Amycolatopsis sp. GM8]|uniref:hypothetical protein n=1 Tax=Amycolatopsis sp. GM8 TaxID=2896530 RepID=UPI001F2F6E2A|nr:hypothetical protein [Amycolatopsis sp. GM8]
MTTPTKARTVVEWLAEGRDVLEQMRAEVELKTGAGAPIVQEDLAEGIRLAKQLVKLDEARR